MLNYIQNSVFIYSFLKFPLPESGHVHFNLALIIQFLPISLEQHYIHGRPPAT